MAIQPGTRLGPYEVLSAIGAGGMGEVYRARDSKLGRDVAVKVLSEAFARDAERMARFQREAKVLASLNHPNIAAIYGFEDSSTTHALVMELVEGQSLADRIKSGSIPVDEALRIAKQITEALEYAHERGIVHRDLKPANVKMTNEDAVKILDFGLAKALEVDGSSLDLANSPTLTRMATQPGILLGTAAYMSPEQAKAKPVDRRADIWAFGCVLFEMLTGKMAFHGETVTDTLAAIVMKEPDWSQLPPATPTLVLVLLKRCLQKDPKQRLRDIGEGRIAINEILDGAPESSPSIAAVATTSASIWSRALPWILGSITGALIVGLIVWKVAVPARVPAANPMRFQIPITSTLAPGGGRFAISPDGRELAFAATSSDGISRLWVRALNSLEARPLPGTEASLFPPFFWSSDSRYIAFGAYGKLKRIDVASGAVEALCSTPGIVVGGSWNPDGIIIFGSFPGSVMRVSASGGTAAPLTTLDPLRQEIYHAMPSFLPDGRHFIYERVSSNGGTGVYIGSINVKPDEQDSKPLMVIDSPAEYARSLDADAGQLLFVRNGSLMAQRFDTRKLSLSGDPVTVAENIGTFQGAGFFSVSANGILVYRTGNAVTAALQFTWFNRQGEVLGTAGEPGNYGYPALSPDGAKAAFTQTQSNGDYAIWLFDLARGRGTRLTFDSSALESIWSADGQRVIFSSNHNGGFDLYEKLANGASDEKLLLKSSELKRPTDASRDGRYLLYDSVDTKTDTDIWVLPLQGNSKPFAFLVTNSNESDAHFSPDGHWVAYVSDESRNGSEIYVRPFSADSNAADASGAGPKWQVSYGGGGEPRWSADGKEIYYLTPDSKVMEADVTISPSFQVGMPKFLFQAPRTINTNGNYTIDGNKFLFLATTGKAGQAQAPFTVVLNWQEGLNH